MPEVASSSKPKEIHILAFHPNTHLCSFLLCVLFGQQVECLGFLLGAKSLNQWPRTISHTQFETLTSMSASHFTVLRLHPFENDMNMAHSACHTQHFVTICFLA